MTLILGREVTKTCQACHKRPAERQILLISGKKQWRCEICRKKRNPPGFKKRKSDDSV